MRPLLFALALALALLARAQFTCDRPVDLVFVTDESGSINPTTQWPFLIAFIAQLAQFATVEQLTSSNDLLEGVYAAIAAMNNASMASLVGSGVIARGNEFYYDASGSKDLYFNAPSEVQSATLTVYNEAGAVVFTGNLGSLPEGESITNWDGRDSNGTPLPEGTYTFKVTGLDIEGNVIDVEERITGTITEMDYSSGTPMPSVDGITMSIGDILTLTAGTP